MLHPVRLSWLTVSHTLSLMAYEWQISFEAGSPEYPPLFLFFAASLTTLKTHLTRDNTAVDKSSVGSIERKRSAHESVRWLFFTSLMGMSINFSFKKYILLSDGFWAGCWNVATFRPPICIKSTRWTVRVCASARRAYIFVKRTDTCSILVRMLARLVARRWYICYRYFDLGFSCVRKLRKLTRVHISVRGLSVCVPVRVHAHPRVCVRICVMWVRCLSRGQNDQLSPQSRFICVPSPRTLSLPTTRRDLTILPPGLHASIASMRV